MNFVIPMAGAGSRFAKVGYDLPKPLIPVRGEPMYRWAVSSLDLRLATRLIFIVRRDEHTADLVADIERTFAAHDPRVLVLEHLTRGQAETVYLAKDLIDPSRATLVHNADTGFVSGPENWEFGNKDGALLTFASDETRWSFARVGADGRVVEVAEKKVISNHASTGTYYFRDTPPFFERLAALTRGGQKDELYIGPMYNDLIKDGADVAITTIRRLLCFGTPEDLTVTLAELESAALERTALVRDEVKV